MDKLTAMPNIGKELAKKLTSIGIDSPEKLMESGAKNAFRLMKSKYPNVCLVHLYALEGAVRNTEFNSLPDDTKQDLKAFSDALKKQNDMA